MLPIIIITGTIFSSGVIGGFLSYKYCLFERKKNIKNVSFDLSDYSDCNSTILKSPILSSPEKLNDFEINNNI